MTIGYVPTTLSIRAMTASCTKKIHSASTSRTMTTTMTTTKNDATEHRPPIPPFSFQDAVTKVRMAEDAWNSCDPSRVKMAYTKNSTWRNRNLFLHGRDEIETFLTTKWQNELEYRLIKEIWCHDGTRIAVRFCYEFQDAQQGQWFRAYGNENWKFDSHGLMEQRFASINNVAIQEDERLFHWDRNGPRPDDHPGLTELGL